MRMVADRASLRCSGARAGACQSGGSLESVRGQNKRWLRSLGVSSPLSPPEFLLQKASWQPLSQISLTSQSLRALGSQVRASPPPVDGSSSSSPRPFRIVRVWPRWTVPHVLWPSPDPLFARHLPVGSPPPRPAHLLWQRPGVARPRTLLSRSTTNNPLRPS